MIHPHCCEAGAIGAALEAAENCRSRYTSSFPGFDFLDRLKYSVRRDESTRCHFCTNRCLRTFVDLSSDAGSEGDGKRVIIATCARGEAETTDDVKKINSDWHALRQSLPNYVQLAAEKVWVPVQPSPAASISCHDHSARLSRRIQSKLQQRARVRIGIPRVLNLYIYAPLFSAYFANLGIPSRNLHYSHFTSPEPVSYTHLVAVRFSQGEEHCSVTVAPGTRSSFTSCTVPLMFPSCGAGASVPCAKAGNAIMKQNKGRYFLNITAILTSMKKCMQCAKHPIR